jgi:biotin synthase-related radical SAM superfamily protein
MTLLPEAVQIFGRGKVCSNIIIGLGECDENVLAGIGTLAKMGVVATVRKLAIDPSNRKRLKKALGRVPQHVLPERLLSLAQNQKGILQEYDLDTRGFRTMCHNCACCDIEPFVDV